MSTIPTLEQELERALLKRCVGILESDRERCQDCGRTPLVGEQLHVFDGRRKRVVCELCRPGRGGSPVETFAVRHLGASGNVRLTARAA